jgi:hypothetical protein
MLSYQGVGASNTDDGGRSGPPVARESAGPCLRPWLHRPRSVAGVPGTPEHDCADAVSGVCLDCSNGGLRGAEALAPAALLGLAQRLHASACRRHREPPPRPPLTALAGERSPAGAPSPFGAARALIMARRRRRAWPASPPAHPPARASNTAGAGAAAHRTAANGPRTSASRPAPRVAGRAARAFRPTGLRCVPSDAAGVAAPCVTKCLAERHLVRAVPAAANRARQPHIGARRPPLRDRP